MEVRSWVVGVPINKIIRLMEVFGWLSRHPRSWQWWYEKLTAMYNIQQYFFNPWNIFWEYLVHKSFDNIWGISYDFENWLGMYLFRNIWGTFLLWWKACIWARLIFSLLIIRLDIVSLRYMRTTFTYFWYHIFRLSFGSFGFFGKHNFIY